MTPVHSMMTAVWLVMAPWAAAHGEILNNTIRIGVLTDLSGPTSYATGPGSVAAARLAVEDAKAFLPGVTIEVIEADHQNKADIASGIARDWVANRGVNVITDVPFSSAGLAVNEVTRGAPRTAFVVSSSGTSDLTGSKCSPNTVQWTYDTYAQSNVIARALTNQGAKTWFFMTADYAFGQAMERDATGILKSLGGTVVGAVKHPVFGTDFSSFLLQAQASHADVIAFANATADTINSIKQAHEFGISGGAQRIAALLTIETDIEAIGLPAAQGIYVAAPFYWDLNEGTRAFSARFAAVMNGRKPTLLQAGVYSGVLGYLKAVKEINTTEEPQVVEAMKRMPTDDPAFGHGSIRADGRKLHDYYLLRIKAPSESKSTWDIYSLVQTVRAEDAFRPMAEGGCPLVK